MPKILALKTRKKVHKRHFNIHVYRRTTTSGKYKCVPFKQYKVYPKSQLEVNQLRSAHGFEMFFG